MSVPQVKVVMATYDGSPFIHEQLASLEAQSHKNWSLLVSDDGSRDDTVAQVQRFARAYPHRDIQVMQGPAQGSGANFLSALQACATAGPLEYTAFCDQDDVWLSHKLARAIGKIAACGGGEAEAGPVVYASHTFLTDANLSNRRVSRTHHRTPGFGNALVQNILGGNTIVMNPSATALVAQTAAAALKAGVPYHDWWVYLMITGVGGQVIIDAEPGLLYRQHEANLLGGNQGARPWLARFQMLKGSEYRNWISANLTALEAVSPVLTPEARAMLERFSAWRQTPGTSGMDLRRMGIYRQTRPSDLVLAILGSMGRL